MKSIRISAPYLTDDERKEAATGYTGPPADTDKLLGTWDPSEGRKFTPDPVLGALQMKPVFSGVDPAEVAHRRKRGKAAKAARRTNRKRSK